MIGISIMVTMNKFKVDLNSLLVYLISPYKNILNISCFMAIHSVK